jgi:anti-sigma factor RsiW
MMRLVTDRPLRTPSRPIESAAGEELEKLWLAALSGDLSAEERETLDRRLAREPELRRAFERWQRAWSRVEDPPEVRLPLEFGRRIARAARAANDDPRPREAWRAAPGWVRWASAVALVSGIAAGVALSGPVPIGVSSIGRASVGASSTGTAAVESRATQVATSEDGGSAIEGWVDGELLEASAPSLWEGLASGELTDAGEDAETGSS